MLAILFMLIVVSLTTIGSLSIILSMVTEQEANSQYIPTQPTLNATKRNNELDKDIEEKILALEYITD